MRGGILSFSRAQRNARATQAGLFSLLAGSSCWAVDPASRGSCTDEDRWTSTQLPRLANVLQLPDVGAFSGLGAIAENFS